MKIRMSSCLYEDLNMHLQILSTLHQTTPDILHFIDETHQYSDYKPFFTDMWDAIILAGKRALLPFELFQSLQRTYSWMKYYNSELDSRIDKALEEHVRNSRRKMYENP